METLIYKDETGTIQTVLADLSYGIEVKDIEEGKEWVLTTKDTSPATYTSPHIGGRPDDR